MADNDPAFRAYKVLKTRVPTYFIESTAPNNVDDSGPPPPVQDPELELIPQADDAIRAIAAGLAADLAAGRDPNLVVMVHGFNNPQDAVLATYRAAARAIKADAAISSHPGLVCVGYRWPSERMGAPIQGSWDALPTLPTWILYLGLALVLLSFPLFYWIGALPTDWARHLGALLGPISVHVLVMLGWTLAGLILTAVLLRAIVYFRDNYRAMNYGVPDLIQIIQAIDTAIGPVQDPQASRPRVQLSFIGHSMGGFVVTNAIRSLSDLFAAPMDSLDDPAAASDPARARPGRDPHNIGNHLQLKRFVLVSPDIPAETLLSVRANFLAASLLRFDEAYLFSSEGDEVLRQISTLANYFVFPTKSRNYGFRLGNVEILSRGYGLIDVAEYDFIRTLRVGNLTVQELAEKLTAAAHLRAAHLRAAAARRAAHPGPLAVRQDLPKVFTYFDCTDYVDADRDGSPSRPLLTFALRSKRKDPNARLPWYAHLRLLLAYLVRGRPNVHGGYFEGDLGQRLIYRFACLGYRDTIGAWGGEGALSQVCAEKQIRVLLSPRLATLTRAGQAAARVAAPAGISGQAAPAAAFGLEPGAAPPPAAAPAVAIGIAVPALVGLPIEQARAAVRALTELSVGGVRVPIRGGAGLRILEFIERSTESPGTVLRQTPAPGTLVARDTAIEVFVAQP